MVPRENGYNESFNGKLRDELLNCEIFYTLKEAKILIEQWRQQTKESHFNEPDDPKISPAVMTS